MSGGSFDYIYSKVEDAKSMVRSNATRPEHLAFADHLTKVAKALHDIEWMLSGDIGNGDELPAIMECITPSDVLECAITSATIQSALLNEAIEKAKATLTP
jgi:hypothetical protein